MNKIKIAYFTVTGLFAAFMFFTAIPNVMMNEDSISLISTTLGFPQYFIMLIGVAKILGVIGIVVPGFPRIREWAYAGLFFDLAGATWASVAAMGAQPGTMFMFVFIAFHLASYFLYHKYMAQKGTPVVR